MIKDTLLVIPAFNEEKNIGMTLSGLLKDGIDQKMDILVVDDGSDDGTLTVIRSYSTRVMVIEHIFHMGYGAALQTGYKYAVKHHYSYLVQMDADGQHDHRFVTRILSRLKGEIPAFGTDSAGDAPAVPDRIPDIVIGSRFLEEKGDCSFKGMKKGAISFFRFLIKRATGYRLTDPTSGFQGLNRKAFVYYSGYMNFDLQYPDLNMLVQMIFRGFHVEEVPVIMYERFAGDSMHTGFRHQVRYMAVMLISTFNACTRNYKVCEERKEKRESK